MQCGAVLPYNETGTRGLALAGPVAGRRAEDEPAEDGTAGRREKEAGRNGGHAGPGGGKALGRRQWAADFLRRSGMAGQAPVRKQVPARAVGAGRDLPVPAAAEGPSARGEVVGISGRGTSLDNSPQVSGSGDGRARKRPVWKKVAAIAVIILLILLLLTRCGHGEDPSASGSVMFGVIDVGDAGDGDGAPDLQELANAALEENMFRVFIATRMEVDMEGAFAPMIQNTSVNRHPCWVEIVDDDGSTVYESDMVGPGYKIEQDVLPEPLTRGKHDCKAYFHVMEGADKDAREINAICIDVVMVQRG